MCGIFGIENDPDAANLAYLGLYALQHRGQESAGIVSYDGSRLHVERGMGHVADIFGAKTIARLPGSRAIGHTRNIRHQLYQAESSAHAYELLHADEESEDFNYFIDDDA